MIAIIDYGVGNLFSLLSSFRSIGADVQVTSDEDVIRSADKIVLPGVGAFEDAAKKLRDRGLDKVIKEECAKGKLLIGICLGMQLLFEKSYEYGEHEGLGLISGSVRPLSELISEDLKIPHIGWNALSFAKDSFHGQKDELFKYLNEGDFVYFVHSFYGADCADSLIATTEYGATVTAAVRKNNVMGVQFHPEKSEKVGLAILKAFCQM